jgi:hypothetical protein
MALKLNIDGDDVDQLAMLHAPGLVPHLVPRPAAPPPVAPEFAGPVAPSPIPTETAQPASPPRGIGLHVGEPTVTAQAGSPGYYKQKIQDLDWKQQNPWGSPENHPGFLGKLAHIAGQVGNIAGGILDPGATALIPGSTLNRSLQRGADTRGLEQATAEETAKQRANTEQEGVEQKPDLLEAQGEVKGRLEAQKEQSAADRDAAKQADADKRTQATLDSLEGREDKRLKLSEQQKKEQQDFERQIHSEHEANENKRLAIRETGENARATDKKSKPTADEQRRADLAENLNENLNTLEDIAKRRPDLFGPMAGRLTQLRGAIGTGDKDIATLETIKHQIGMAQISAHGMRSAHGIEAAADSILNNLHNQPDAVLANVKAVRDSIKTFQQDVERAKGEAPATAPAGPAPKTAEEWLRGKTKQP